MKCTRNPDVLWREEEEPREQAMAALDAGEDAEDVGTSILFHDGKILSLNVLGTEIWKLCDGRSFDELVQAVAESFEVEESVVAADAAAFLDELKKQGFVHDDN